MKNFIEKNTVWIGAGLILLSLVGGTLLMIKKGASADDANQNIVSDDRDKKIADLEKQIADLQKENADLKSQASQQSATSVQPAGKININSATQSQLESLPGIGSTYAQRIIDYRNQHGGFKSTIEIKNVKGIGDKTYLKFKDLITI
ncbi:MAG: competence protein ComEA [Candidatus Berkelbacteria bacterium Athens1014_28]|uniref:Competence protein ComEA n=1 Tax=Candidatus Berkelbacteria bacterium Athens1014_28 TaxID=2017145 RepID=A0A554LJ82_9BACT|nr:MAG: competence protein ComEA [Candidatus Berkelbacteria bacterium Athens1014_28]